MTAGTYSFAGKKPTGPVKYELVPDGVYVATLRTSGSEIRPPKEPGKAPNINVRCDLPEMLSQGGKPRVVFGNINLSLKPGKDEKVNPERANGLLAIATALGVELPDFDTVELQDVDEGTFNALNAQQVLEWLKEQDGGTVRIDLGHRKANEKMGYEASNDIKAYMPVDGAPAWEQDEDEVPAEEEEKPAPKTAQRAASKPVAKPTKKR